MNEMLEIDEWMKMPSVSGSLDGDCLVVNYAIFHDFLSFYFPAVAGELVVCTGVLKSNGKLHKKASQLRGLGLQFSGYISVFYENVRNSGNEDEVDFRGGNVHVITSKSDWEQKIAEANKDGKIVVANFSATWCGPCRTFARVYRELSEKYPSLIFLAIDVDDLMLAPFDSTKKKKKKKVVIQDPADEVDKLTEKTESLTVDDVSEPSFVALKKKKKKKKKPVETVFLNDENGGAGEDLNGDQIGGDEEGEGIVLGVVRYPWEGTDRDYKYDEVC
ncbi:eukaryotic translation initiation factor 2 [Musa troglodytarum]|uniref:Eukaryotic translation initiation factor 2 n=2 Tax=Musa troglodytarum TaxID=320322 RepID=A0A9E7KLY2_9LILI|nr:eukaryotic translation initiation factor 2 [Musa troglodytarum]